MLFRLNMEKIEQEKQNGQQMTKTQFPVTGQEESGLLINKENRLKNLKKDVFRLTYILNSKKELIFQY